MSTTTEEATASIVSTVKDKAEQQQNQQIKKDGKTEWKRIFSQSDCSTKTRKSKKSAPPEAKEKVAEILIEKFDIFAFTMIECSGYYRMQSTGRIVAEPSLRIEIATDDELTAADAIIGELKETLNQESIMHEIATAEIYFK